MPLFGGKPNRCMIYDLSDDAVDDSFSAKYVRGLDELCCDLLRSTRYRPKMALAEIMPVAIATVQLHNSNPKHAPAYGSNLPEAKSALSHRQACPDW